VNQHAQIRKMQMCISQPQEDRTVFCHADRERLLCILLSTPSPGNRSFAWQANAMRRCGEYGSSTPCFCSWENGRRGSTVSLLVGGIGILRSMPSRQAFPSSADSPVFSLLTSGHSLGAGPAPGGASMFCFKPFGSGFPTTNFPRKGHAGNFLPDPPQKAHLGLGSGAHSRRFAQECPGGNPGKYKQEKNNGTLRKQRHAERLHR
jgi:hypothetical protein